MPLIPGDTLFEYRITRTLGQGAFSTVFIAYDTLVDRFVAIRELAVAVQADPLAFQRFQLEARAAGSLNHPNIVTVYDIRHAQEVAWLVMEYFPCISLRTLLTHRGHLSASDSVWIAASLCDGLAAAHSKGVVHQDVRPENILIAADGQIKVGNFGVVHASRSVGSKHFGGMPLIGFRPGVLVYMSPEQIRGKQLDERSDVYQIGAIVYEMLAGQQYVNADKLASDSSHSNIARRQIRWYSLLEKTICRAQRRDLSPVLSQLPISAARTVRSALAKERAQRPTTEELAQSLHNCGAMGQHLSLADEAGHWAFNGLSRTRERNTSTRTISDHEAYEFQSGSGIPMF